MIDIEREIGALADLPRSDLLKRWRTLHRTTAPKCISRRMLVGAIAYAMQAKMCGGLKPAVRRQLRKMAHGDVNGGKINAVGPSKLMPGARLIREWNGRTHVVEVIDGGFVWNGERHGSLSAVARTITGARWSGPRFFGLTSESAS
ncbi:MAG: DUF2924 domain-containing protein [Gemmatimonadota bacterium]